MMRKATDGPLPRGVYVAPWIGPNNEVVLLGITRNHHLVAPPTAIPAGANHVAAGEALWALLDGDDPLPNLKII
jgi:hypothetical protein